MDLLWHYSSLLFIINCIMAEYLIRVDQYNFVPVDREILISQSAFVEQEGNRSYLSGHLICSKPLNDLKMSISLDIARPKLPRIRLFDKKLDLCAFFSNDYKSKFVRQVYNNYMSYLNEPPICPLKAHFNYSLHRGYVDDRYLPEFLPECSFFMKFKFTHKSKPVANMFFEGQISPVSSKALTSILKVKV